MLSSVRFRVWLGLMVVCMFTHKTSQGRFSSHLTVQLVCPRLGKVLGQVPENIRKPRNQNILFGIRIAL